VSTAALANGLAQSAESSVIGGGRLSLAGATLLNGYLVTAVTMCDVHRPTLTHITPEVVPAALAIAEREGQPFSAGIAHQLLAASCLRSLRLEQGLAHADAAIRIFRELGARWELASSLGDRGAIHRMASRLDAAELDLREAFVLCRDLKERALITWTASELARTLAAQGDAGGARGVLADPLARIAEGEPSGAMALAFAEAVTALAEGDRPGARTRSVEALAAASMPPVVPNPHAAAVWWVGSLFGPEAAGGQRAVEEARELLERNGWRQALLEPDLAPRA